MASDVSDGKSMFPGPGTLNIQGRTQPWRSPKSTGFYLVVPVQRALKGSKEGAAGTRLSARASLSHGLAEGPSIVRS
jgi:hypothetical protein